MSESSSPSDAMFFRPKTVPMWDTWTYHHEGQFHLFYLIGTQVAWHGIGSAVSSDGVHWTDLGLVIGAAPETTWIGSGAVWPSLDPTRPGFVMNFSEWRGSHENGRQSIHFAHSADLVDWSRLTSDTPFTQDARWYDVDGRWDCISPLPRPEGGYYGYWTAHTISGAIGLGFGESSDGLSWDALPPPRVEGVTSRTAPNGGLTVEKPHVELSSVHDRGDAIYGIISDPDFGMSVVTSSSPSGPFVPALTNRQILSGNASYFCRFVDVGDEVLVNHQSWVPIVNENPDYFSNFAGDVHLAPLKLAHWDEVGTLRLRWWPGNERAKSDPADVVCAQTDDGRVILLLSSSAPASATHVLEGTLTIDDATITPAGFAFYGHRSVATITIEPDGAVVYSAADTDGNPITPSTRVQRSLSIDNSVSFRLVIKERFTEFYVNDFLMMCFTLPEPVSDSIELLGTAANFSTIQAWYTT